MCSTGWGCVVQAERNSLFCIPQPVLHILSLCCTSSACAAHPQPVLHILSLCCTSSVCAAHPQSVLHPQPVPHLLYTGWSCSPKLQRVTCLLQLATDLLFQGCERQVTRKFASCNINFRAIHTVQFVVTTCRPLYIDNPVSSTKESQT